MRLEIQNVNTNKLHDELIKAGITPSLVESLDNTTWITIEDNEEAAVLGVIAIHDPTPLPQPKSDEEKLRIRINALENALMELI